MSNLVVLFLITLGFLAQSPFDRFGYLMGVAWLAIVYGCLDMWRENRAKTS